MTPVPAVCDEIVLFLKVLYLPVGLFSGFVGGYFDLTYLVSAAVVPVRVSLSQRVRGMILEVFLRFL